MDFRRCRGDRGQRRIEDNLRGDGQSDERIRAIVDGQSQTDPTFQSQRLDTRLTAKEVRKQLIEQKGYRDEELPGEEAIRRRINALGYKLRPVRKSQPKKR